ncbi:ferritin-3, chloroplastic-like, partial [Glycine soja]|uniref:ferritin-3, chloroplastic n=1 Tax=Glycine max TaxID=3847 RepID=UPI00103BCB12
FSLLKANTDHILPLPNFSFSGIICYSQSQGKNLVPCATKDSNNHPLTDVIFEPFEEVKKELNLVPTVPQASLARKKYTNDYKATIKEQISVEYNVSYVYHVIFAYFDRDNVALKGLAKVFKESSEEERVHAEKLMEYQV